MLLSGDMYQKQQKVLICEPTETWCRVGKYAHQTSHFERNMRSKFNAYEQNPSDHNKNHELQ